jgi:hypothetical protein
MKKKRRIFIDVGGDFIFFRWDVFSLDKNPCPLLEISQNS